LILAGDIGGTKILLASYRRRNGGSLQRISMERYASPGFSGVEPVIEDFLGRYGRIEGRLVLGVAGPVIGDRAEVTNLGWIVDASSLKRRFGFDSVHLINDLAAAALAVPDLEDRSFLTINEGSPAPLSTIAVIAPGTGLGEAVLFHDASGYRAMASEGGHGDFAPTDRLQIGLLGHLLKRYDHVSYEKVCSGRGIPHIHEYLELRRSDSGGQHGERLPGEAQGVGADRTASILAAATDPTNPAPLCRRTLEVFLSILAAEAGNLALRTVARGGVVLGGGILPRIAAAVDRKRFMRDFTNKGRMSPFLQTIPVRMLLEPDAALLGAALYGLNR